MRYGLVKQQRKVDSLGVSTADSLLFPPLIKNKERRSTPQRQSRMAILLIKNGLKMNFKFAKVAKRIPSIEVGLLAGGREHSRVSYTTSSMAPRTSYSRGIGSGPLWAISLPWLQQKRFASKKTDKPKVAGWDKSLKKASKRLGKYYKMKTHKGAAQRWQVVGPSSEIGLKRAKCGQSHLRRKNQSWKKRALRERILANGQQKNFLKKLLPYHAKRYSRL